MSSAELVGPLFEEAKQIMLEELIDYVIEKKFELDPSENKYIIRREQRGHREFIATIVFVPEIKPYRMNPDNPGIRQELEKRLGYAVNKFFLKQTTQ